MTLGVWRDESGSYTNNLEEISLGFDLPLFNRNQHQIKIAKYQLEQAKLNDSLQQNTLENEVAQAYSAYSNLNIQFNSKDKDYNHQLDDLNNDAISNYSKRLINLVDFLDQIRTFTTSRLSYYQLKKQYQDAVNLLNFVTGTTIIK
jgi:cobalt-zinc-cadmium efflux system outer membrane protein